VLEITTGQTRISVVIIAARDENGFRTNSLARGAALQTVEKYLRFTPNLGVDSAK